MSSRLRGQNFAIQDPIQGQVFSENQERAIRRAFVGFSLRMVRGRGRGA